MVITILAAIKVNRLKIIFFFPLKVHGIDHKCLCKYSKNVSIHATASKGNLTRLEKRK